MGAIRSKRGYKGIVIRVRGDVGNKGFLKVIRVMKVHGLSCAFLLCFP